MTNWIDETPKGYNKLRNNSGEYYFIHKCARLSCDVSIGRYTYIHSNTNITGIAKVKIGNFCSIADNVSIFAGNNHNYYNITTYPFKHILDINLNAEEVVGGDVIIENDVWIGSGSYIISNKKRLTIGNGAVIGANTVITKDIKPYSINVGNPSRCIGYRFNDKVIQMLMKSNWWLWTLDEIKDNVDFFQKNYYKT